MAIPCQASKEEGVTTIGSSPSTLSIDTAMEVHTIQLNTTKYILTFSKIYGIIKIS